MRMYVKTGAREKLEKLGVKVGTDDVNGELYVHSSLHVSDPKLVLPVISARFIVRVTDDITRYHHHGRYIQAGLYRLGRAQVEVEDASPTSQCQLLHLNAPNLEQARRIFWLMSEGKLSPDSGHAAPENAESNQDVALTSDGNGAISPISLDA